MRKPSIAAASIVVLASLSAVGCEDGPSDNYSPAHAGAGWNNPSVPPVANDAGQGFVTSTAGTNANDICTPDQIKAARAKYFSAPIMPPGIAAGLDIAGGPKGDGAAGYQPGTPFKYDPTTETWTGATVEQAEKILCQGTPDSIFQGISTTLGWGDAGEVSVLYNPNNRLIQDVILATGYQGSIEADSSDGKTHYSIKFNSAPMTKTTAGGAAQSVILRWGNTAGLNTIANGLYDALRNTFQPNFPPDTDCVAAGHCIIGNNFSNGGYLWFTPLNMVFFVQTTIGTDIANSAFILVDIGKLKLLGFSTASAMLKLDAAGEGPVATKTNVWGQGKTCNYKFGMLFSDFKTNCVEPFGDATSNLVEERKLFGSMGHGDETYQFDVQGVDPQFAASSLAPNAIVGDGDRPQPNDTAFEFQVDQQLLGKVSNDYANNDPSQANDLHGIGLVTLEWANLVQKYMKQHYGVTADLGDPDCIANPVRPVASTGDAGATMDGGTAADGASGVDGAIVTAASTTTGTTGAGKVCSGIEGIVTTAPPAAAITTNMARNALGAAIAQAPGFNSLALGLKPGTWYSFFCTDGQGLGPNGPIGYDTGSHRCYGQDAATHNGYYFDTMEYMVQNAYGGAVSTPKALTDLRFYFQQWILALVKYLQVADNPSATLADIDSQPVSEDNLFFDTSGAPYEFGEYVDRHSVNAGNQPPTDLRIDVNLLTSVVNEFDFTRYNLRGEKALYRALTTSPADQPGAEGLLLSNLVGSPVLGAAYGTYKCAIGGNPKTCGNALGPADDQGHPLTDDNGRPFLTAYQGAFGKTIFNLPAQGAPSLPSALSVPTATTSTISGEAMVLLPQWTNPFDPTSAKPGDPMISAFIPYAPKGAGVGFPVAVDGSRDKFVNTYSVDFSGISVSANVDYDFVGTADGGSSLVIKAVETQDFLGYVFMCAEPNPHTGLTDVLAVRMYTPSQDILDWFTTHPNGTADCDVVYQYSIYGNYPNYITSRANGIRLGINPGFGGGRVTDVTVFDPNVVASLGE